MTDVKFSDFTDGEELRIGDIVVGLRSSANYKFDFPSDGFKDGNDNYLIQYATAGAAAVNYIKFTNSNASSPTIISTDGTDTNIGLDIKPKGIGKFAINTTTGIDSIIDDDTMATATATNISTSEAIVAYVAATAGGAGGSNTQVQYNNAGTLAGDTGFTTDGAGSLTVVGDLSVDNLNFNGNTIISTNTDGDITITPDGAGVVLAGSNIDMQQNDLIDVRRLDFNTSWRLEDVTVGAIERLLMSAQTGGTGIAELALAPIGAALESRIILTNSPNLNNFEALSLKSNGTENSVDSAVFGSGTLLPLELQMNSVAAFVVNIDESLSAESNQINNLADPTLAQDAATKAYVDSRTDITFMTPVLAASTVNFASTYANGTAGVGATLTASANGAFTLDGEAGVLDARYLIKNQTNTFENGIYTLSTVGTAGTPAILTRATDFDQPVEIDPGDIVPVINGTVNAATSWLQTATVVTIGTDPIVFTQWSAAVTNVVTLDGTQTITGAKTMDALLLGGIMNLNGFTIPGAGLLWADIAGTSQAAAVDTGYTCSNAAATTVTLPATAAVGSVVALEGIGAGGWVLTANTGQTIQIGSGVTSSGGTLTSAAATDNVYVTCIVADSTWRVRSTNSAGLTIA